MRYSHSALEVCDLGDLEDSDAAARGRHPAHRPRFQPRPRRLHLMKHYLGVDIGTFETKSVLVDAGGRDRRAGRARHKMLVPQPGWAEHRPREDWWGDFQFVTQKVLAESGIDPKSIRAVGCSAIGPCLLPVDETGEPLLNAILYGVDTRAAREIAELNEAIGADLILERCGNALTSQIDRPQDPVAQEPKARTLRKDGQDPELDQLHQPPADGPLCHRSLHRRRTQAHSTMSRRKIGRSTSPTTSHGSTSCPSSCGRPTSRGR